MFTISSVIGLCCLAFVVGVVALTKLAVYLFIDRSLSVKSPSPLADVIYTPNGEFRISNVDDLYAHAGLSEEEEWVMRAEIAKARARLFDKIGLPPVSASLRRAA